MKLKSPCFRPIFAGLALVVAIALAGCPPPRDETYSGMQIDLFDSNFPKTQQSESVETGDSLSLGFRGLAPGAPVQVFLNDDSGKEWSYARRFADKKGVIEPAIFWYHTGVIGTTSRKINFKPGPAFITFDEAEVYFAKHPLKLTIKNLKGQVVGEKALPIKPRKTPMLYPSNRDGVLVNSFDVTGEDIYATGKNFAPGSVVHVFVVRNQYVWNAGDKLADVSGRDGTQQVEKVTLAADQTSFTVKVWEQANGRPGAFDLVARTEKEPGEPALKPGDVLSYGDDTGFLYYIIVNGNIVIESAGRTRAAPAKFEFSDSFEKLEDVWAAVDPTDVPAVHSGGNYAAYYVVEHQPNSYWDGPAPALTDVSGGIEIQRVKYWCINLSRRLVWPGATQADPIKAYDLIVDFGATPAMNAAAFVQDDVYNKGTDFIDGYDTDAGFWVFEDPSTAGPFPVGQVELDEPNGISGITDPTGTTGPMTNITLAWARIMYPATAAGTGTPVSDTFPNYPVALFLHGKHQNCDNDGSEPESFGTVVYSCAAANRIPSHEGYNYIMERLASQGVFCISISAHQIQPGLGVWEYDARGRLVLKFLDKLKDWTVNGTDPFGGIFTGKLDLSRIALSGHSRGGEGVVAAQEINKTLPTPHSILAVNAIAPTDQNVVSYLMTDASYFLLLGARDGDVTQMQGFRTYDRGFPEGAPFRHPKMVAWVYQANHNYFNTIWTDTAALGSPNPWAGARDDSNKLPAMSAANQRQVALTTIAAFFRRHLQAIEPYREIFTGRLKPAAMPNNLIFWTYQDDERKAVDDFEQTPFDPNTNRLTGAVTAPNFIMFEERLLNSGDSDYPLGLARDTAFYHDTLGLKLAWGSRETYTTLIPAGQGDVSMFTHLTFRAAKKAPLPPSAGPPVNLLVNIEDGAGKRARWDLRTDQFHVIPHPFEGSSQALMNSVRIPLRHFTMNNSGVDLTNIVKILITTEGDGEIGLDDIEFGK